MDISWPFSLSVLPFCPCIVELFRSSGKILNNISKSMILLFVYIFCYGSTWDFWRILYLSISPLFHVSKSLRKLVSWTTKTYTFNMILQQHMFCISSSIFRLSPELLNIVFNIAQNPRGPLLQIGVQTSFQSEFFHLMKENFENTAEFFSFC